MKDSQKVLIHLFTLYTVYNLKKHRQPIGSSTLDEFMSELNYCKV